MNRLELAEKLVDRARKLGADEAEAYVLQSSSVEIQIVNEQADSVNYKNSGGYGFAELFCHRVADVSFEQSFAHLPHSF